LVVLGVLVVLGGLWRGRRRDGEGCRGCRRQMESPLEVASVETVATTFADAEAWR